METAARVSAIAPLATTAAVNAAIAPLATAAAVNVGNAPLPTSVSSSAYVTKSELAYALASHSKTDNIASINSTTLSNTLASYATTSMLNAAIAPLATSAALNLAVAPLATIVALNDAIAQVNTTQCLPGCVTKELMSEFFPTITQLASNNTFQVFQDASLQYIPSTIVPPTVNNQMQTLVSSIGNSIVAQATLSVVQC